MVIRPRDDPKKPGISFEYVDKPSGPKYLVKGARRHVMIAKNGTYIPARPPDEIKLLPDKLYRAFLWYETERLLAWKNTLLELAIDLRARERLN